MEWNLKIPKILHVYWGGGILYYLRFMTVKTFMKHNPDWEIRFYYPKFPTYNISWRDPEQKFEVLGKNFINELMNLPITKIPVDFREFGLSNDMSEVHKSDYIRLEILSTVGGLWSDMDIFYIKPMNAFYLNSPEYKDIETFYCDHHYGHSVGFLMGCEGNKFFGKLRDLSKRKYYKDSYQSIGAHLYKLYFSTPESINEFTPAYNMSMDVVYSHDATYFPEILSQNQTKFTEKSIGLHWYAGSPLWKGFIEKTNGGLTNLPDNVIGNLLRNEQ